MDGKDISKKEMTEGVGGSFLKIKTLQQGKALLKPQSKLAQVKRETYWLMELERVGYHSRHC